MTPQDRLLAFETLRLGADTLRLNGKVERGSGSMFDRRMSPTDVKRHAALEAWVAADEDARAAFTAYNAAEARADQAAYAALKFEPAPEPASEPAPVPQPLPPPAAVTTATLDLGPGAA